jgi:hypothetical protein
VDTIDALLYALVSAVFLLIFSSCFLIVGFSRTVAAPTARMCRQMFAWHGLFKDAFGPAAGAGLTGARATAGTVGVTKDSVHRRMVWQI